MGIKVENIGENFSKVGSEDHGFKNLKKVNYPDFYKIMVSKKVAEKLNLRTDLPFVEILEIKKKGPHLMVDEVYI